jgi:uroporphyrinogen-III synthase
MRPLVIIRPEPGCSATLAAARAGGMEAVAAPLFRIIPRPWDAPDPATIDGLLLGSANALRAAGPDLALYRGKPAHSVGENTRRAARVAGFGDGMTGEGGLQEVLCALPSAPVRLLRLAGEEHVALAVPPQIRLETRVVYAAEPLPLPASLAETLAVGALVLLHSAAAARHFAGEVDRQGIARSRIAIAALGPRIAAAAGAGWAASGVAEKPNDPALLALATKMCH